MFVSVTSLDAIPFLALHCTGNAALYFYICEEEIKMCKEGTVFLFGNRFLWCRCNFNPPFLKLCAISRWQSRHICRFTMLSSGRKKTIVQFDLAREILIVHQLVLSALYLILPWQNFN